MSKSRIAMAAIILATLLPSAAAFGRGVGLGPLGFVRSAFAHLLPFGGVHHHHYRHFGARHSHARNVNLSDRETKPQNHTAAVSSAAAEQRQPSPRDLISNPAARGAIVAATAMAGWHGGPNGWWRHGDGGYGWVGPLFWPFAYDDIYDYTIYGDGTGFWDYGYADIYAAIFAPYSKSDLAAYLGPGQSSQRQRNAPSLLQFCGGDARDAAGLPVDQIKQTIEPNDSQRSALDDLVDVSTKAAQIIQASCPSETPSTAPARLADMQKRLEAMINAELSLQPPFGKFYDLLDDEQKERLNALSENRRKASSATGGKEPSPRRCDARQSPAPQWPANDINDTLHPNDSQRAALQKLQAAAARASDMLKDACEEDDAITPPARLAAADRRLVAMLEAVKLVSSALDDFYDTLSDQQKAQFEAIGPKRTA
jgi:hypothetical protein